MHLPPLPAGLDRLECRRCPLLAELGALPDALHYMVLVECGSVEHLPRLPVRLILLRCSDCRLLTYLPPLPDSLTDLYCMDCGVIGLPALSAGLLRLAYGASHGQRGRLPEARPRCIRDGSTARAWKCAVSAQHTADRVAAAPHLPVAALLYL